MVESNLRQCPVCGGNINSSAFSCPHCNHALQNNSAAIPEQTLTEIAANMWRGAEAVGGKMQITNYRILFKPHAFNVQTLPAEIPLYQIAQVSPVNTLGFVPNGLSILLKSGVEYKFVVWGRDRLISTIRANITRV